VHPDDLPSVYAQIGRHLQGDLSFYQTEHRLRCQDGTYGWIVDQRKIVGSGVRTGDGANPAHPNASGQRSDSRNCPFIAQYYAGQLNQVSMNLLNNAIDAIEDSNQHRTFQEIEQQSNRIEIHTELDDHNHIKITIADNGTGSQFLYSIGYFYPMPTTEHYYEPEPEMLIRVIDWFVEQWRGCSDEEPVASRAKRASRAKFEAAMAQVPDVEPEEDDRL
jgi:hypothetical protein